MDRDKLTAVGWPHAASSAATQWTHAAGIISNCNARRTSCFISGLISRAQSSAGKPIRWAFAAGRPPADGTGRLSAGGMINRSWEAVVIR